MDESNNKDFVAGAAALILEPAQCLGRGKA